MSKISEHEEAGDDWNDAHVIRKVVSRQQAVPAELMTAAQRGATSSKPDTDLDLDDVAATSPKAKAELEALRAGYERACHDANRYLYLYGLFATYANPNAAWILDVPVEQWDEEIDKAMGEA